MFCIKYAGAFHTEFTFSVCFSLNLNIRNIILITSRFATIAGICVLVAGCAEFGTLSFPARTSSTAQAAETPTVQPQVSTNGNVSAVLAEVQALQNEIKELRNTVERQAFELDRLKNRQSDLYTDLDQRLRVQERDVSQPQAGQVAQVGQIIVPQTNVGTTLSQPTFANVTPSNNNTNGSGSLTLSGSNQATAPTNQGTSQSGQVVLNQPVIVGSTQSGTTQQPEIVVAQPQVATSVSASSITLSAQDAYDEAFALLKRSLYADAVVAFETFVRNYPANDLTDDAYYWMAEARYVTREFSPALAGFQTVTANFPSSQRVPASYLKIGYIQYETGAYVEARETLGFILKNFPTHRVSVSAETRLKKMDREGR